MLELFLESFLVENQKIKDFWSSLKRNLQNQDSIFTMIENYSEPDLGLIIQNQLPDKWPEFAYLWPSGFIFNQEFELSWRYDLDYFIFRLVKENSGVELSGAAKRAKTYYYDNKKELKLLCWGTYDDRIKQWYEGQIPRPVSYPAGKNKYPFIMVTEYFKENALQISRFSGMDSGGEIKDIKTLAQEEE